MANNRVFFYIGANLIGSQANTYHLGFEAASEFFESELKTDENWHYLVEVGSQAEKNEFSNMRFRFFAPWKSGTRVRGWNPPGQDEWDPPKHLGLPFMFSSASRAWEFVCSSIKRNMRIEEKQFVLNRTDRPTLTVNKSFQGKLTLPGVINAVSDCSGRVLQSEFNQFIEALKEQPQFPAPALTISDCNTFHTTGYLWGKYALDFSRAPNLPGAVLIIDIDQHNDAGKSGTGVVASDGWGHPLLDEYPEGAYVVLGTAANSADTTNIYAAVKKKTKGVVSYSCKKKVNPLFANTPQIETAITPTLLRGSSDGIVAAFEKLWSDLEGVLGTQIKHVFVTVDRDSMYGSRTQWKDKDVTFETPEEIYRVIDAISLTMMSRGVTLAGLDVTGLPEEATSDRSLLLGKTDTRAVAKVITDLKKEIAGYCDLFDRLTTAITKYKITVSSNSSDDSLALTYQLKYVPLDLDTQEITLNGQGEGQFLARNIGEWKIKFKSHSVGWSSITPNTNYMLIGGRYAFTVERIL